MNPASAGCEDVIHLRETIRDAWVARESGAWPFAARIVGQDGTLLARAVNAVMASNDPTAHAEVQVIRLAAALSTEEPSGATLYASAEPCAMCAGAIHWAGLGRIVFGVSEQALRRLYGPSAPFSPLTLSCRAVIDSGGATVTVVGPLLEDDAVRPHTGFWTSSEPCGAAS